MKTVPDPRTLQHDGTTLERLLLFCAPVPALALGVIAMRRADVAAGAWLANIAAGVVGLLLLATGKCIPTPSARRTQFALAAGCIGIVLLCFASTGADGVHRWLSLGGLRLHASSLVAPLLITSVAAIAPARLFTAVAIAAVTTTVLALQPDSSQATSFAAACSTLLLFDFRRRRFPISAGVTLLLVVAMSSFIRRDPLPPVPHVEGILVLVGAISPVWAALGALALVLLPLPFFARFRHDHNGTNLALGVYVALITLAPFWGTFPVPVMGYGVSPIIGYFIALGLCRTTPVTDAGSTATSLVSA
jgi:cell division protein FtsW (lipid II flippase)